MKKTRNESQQAELWCVEIDAFSESVSYIEKMSSATAPPPAPTATGQLAETKKKELTATPTAHRWRQPTQAEADNAPTQDATGQPRTGKTADPSRRPAGQGAGTVAQKPSKPNVKKYKRLGNVWVANW